MVAKNIEYVELYTGDRQSAIDYFVSAMGFALLTEAVDADGASALLEQGTARVVVSSGARTKRFLHAHGDGIADIALGCDDVQVTAAAANSAGATVTVSACGDPVVSTFGGVKHTLLKASGTDALMFRGTRVKVSGALPSIRQSIKSLDHVAVCVNGGGLTRCADFYTSAFGIPRYSTEYVDVGDNAMDSVVVRNPTGGAIFTLVAPDRTKGSGQLDAFLDRNGGPGVQHLAFLVDDIVDAVADCRAQGVQFLSTPQSYYDMLDDRFGDLSIEIARLRGTDVLADRDEWGYLLQLFTRSPFERNTLFFELIQRNGSKGFGSANIRALYEAVERDRMAVE